MALRKARTADRDRTVEIINSAYADGQIDNAAREGRVTKALKASTLHQLDQLVIDLQHPGPSAGATPPESEPPGFREQLRRNNAAQRREWRNVPRWQKVLIGVLTVVCIGGVGVATVLDDQPDDTDTSITAGAGTPALTAKGLAAFITTYEKEFDTARVVSATFSADEVVLRVPTDDGKARHVEWRYRDGTFRQFADARRNSDDQAPIDLTEIDLSALEANITQAKRTLRVEDPDSILVWIEREFRERRPSVRIQVGNRFQEVGMYVTDLAGTLIEQTPFEPPASP